MMRFAHGEGETIRLLFGVLYQIVTNRGRVAAPVFYVYSRWAKRIMDLRAEGVVRKGRL